LAGAEYQRPVSLLALAQAIYKPIRYPGVELLLRFVHAKEHIIALQAFGDIESGDIGNPQAGIDGQHNEIPHVLPAPVPMARSSALRSSEGIAGGIDAVHFGVAERRLVRRYR